MFAYEGEDGERVVVIRERCRCHTKRDHIFRTRTENFCFFWNDVSWYGGLLLIALMTICFGIFEFLMFSMLVLKGAPSAINLYLVFPFFSIIVFCELITFVALGVMLWIGVKVGYLKLIKAFPWGLLLGYVFAFVLLLQIALKGESMLRSLVWAQYGIHVKSEPKKERMYLFTERIIFYAIVAFLVIALILFTTYIIILSLSCIDKLEIELENS